jgi:hypothetical protein
MSKSNSKGKIYNYQRCDSSLEIGQNNHDVLVLLAIKIFFGILNLNIILMILKNVKNLDH